MFDGLGLKLALFLAPLLVGVFAAWRAFLKGKLLGINDIFLWAVGRWFDRLLSVSVNLRRYCRLELRREGTGTLFVPGEHAVTLDIDEMFVTLRLESSRLGARRYT